jgi:DNA repair exonuclease SbcCD ATPase subunit
MKPRFFVFIAVIVAAVVLYQKYPGLRAAVDGAASKHLGWTDEAIKDDPAGFIKFAQSELAESIASFEQSRADISTQKRTAEEKLKLLQSKLENADNFATALKAQYQTAKANNSFPVVAANRPYTEEQVIDQVEELLAEKARSQKLIDQYTGILATADTRRAQLTERISESKFKLDELEAQATQVSIDKLSAQADELLAQVNTVLVDNGKLARGETGDPVRPLDQLMAEFDKTAAAAPTSAPKTEALAFLNN